MDPLILPLLFIAVLALPLVLASRRQKKAMAEAQQLQSSLTEGDRVMTTSGLHATVVGTADPGTVDLELAPGVRTTWVRAAIRERLTADSPEASESPEASGSTETSGSVEDSREVEAVAPLEESARPDKS